MFCSPFGMVESGDFGSPFPDRCDNPVAGDMGGYALTGGVGQVAYMPPLGRANDPSRADGDGQQPYSTYIDAPFDRDIFFSTFPEFKDKTLYPAELVESAGKRSRFYVTYEQAAHLDGEERKYVRALMTAHLIVLTCRNRQNAGNGGTQGGTDGGGVGGAVGAVGGSGIISSASVGGVSVSMSVPDSQNPWAYWLNQTQYGQEILAFLGNACPAGIMGMGEFHRVLR